MEDRPFYSEEGYELLDAKTSKLIDELTEGIEVEPFPTEEDKRKESGFLISLSALTANADATAEGLGHYIHWTSSQVATCLTCGCQGNLSRDPLITGDNEYGTFYHGPLFNEECDTLEYEAGTYKGEKEPSKEEGN